MIRVEAKLSGLEATRASLAQALPVFTDELDAAARASAFQVTRTAQKNYLSGPRPSRLGVITNRLRGSLSEGAPDFIFNVQKSTASITVRVGTNVVYAPIHEYSGTIRPKKGRYLAIPTALAKTPAGALKDQYNRPLREIANLFLQRTRSGILFAAEKQPAVGRQRRSGFRVLFWLVKSVTLRARPFLGPALKDSTQWIHGRVNQGLRRAEQRLQALMKG